MNNTATEYGRAKSSVWWDIENCAVPRGCDALGIAQKLSSALIKMNYCGPLSISAYGNTNIIPNSIQQALSSTGIDLNHVPSGKKNASDKKILVDMLLWVVDNPAPANIMLISGDGDFSDALHRLRMRGYNILLVHPQQVSPSLLASAKTTWLWGSLFPGACPLTHWESSRLLDNESYPSDFDVSSHGSSEQVLSKQSMGSEFDTIGPAGEKINGIYVPKTSNQVMQQETRRKKHHMNCTETGESACFCNAACKSFEILTMHLLDKQHAAQWLLKQNLKLLGEHENMVARPSECHEKDVEMTNKMVEAAGVETSSCSVFPIQTAFDSHPTNAAIVKAEALFDVKNIEESVQDNDLHFQSRDAQESMKCLEEQNKELVETRTTSETSSRELQQVFKELRECFDAILKKLVPSINEIVIKKLEEGMPKQGLEMKSCEPDIAHAGQSEHLGENMNEKKKRKSSVIVGKTEAYVCSLCNVSCDYPTILESHLKGRKHTAKIRKLTEALLDGKQIEVEIIQGNGHPKEMIEEIRFQHGEAHEHIECLEKQSTELGENESKPLPNEDCIFTELNPEVSAPQETREGIDAIIKKLEISEDATSTEELESIAKKNLEMNSGIPESNYAGTIEHSEESMKCLEEQKRELVETCTSESSGRELRESFEAMIINKLEPSINEIVIKTLEEGMPKQGLQMKSCEPQNALAGPREHLEENMNEKKEKKKQKKSRVIEDKTKAYVCSVCNVSVDYPTILESHLKGRKHAAKMKKHAEALLDGKQIAEEIIQGNGHPEEMIEEIRFQPVEAHEYIECLEKQKKQGENKEAPNGECIFTKPSPQFSAPQEAREGVDDIIKELELSQDATLTLELESIAKQNLERNSNNPKSNSAGATEYPEEYMDKEKKNDKDELNERELTKVKALIKCIKEHNPGEPLQKRIIQLEKAKAEKKRAMEPTKPQPKRPRDAQPRVTDNNSNKTGYCRVVPERYSHYVYDNRPFLSGPIMAAQAPPPPQTYTFSPAAAHGNFYGNCYQYQPPPPPDFHY